MKRRSPSSVAITCSTSPVIDALEETVTASTSGLHYDTAAGQYVYVWKTVSSWTNSCRQLRVVFKDGTTVTANFKFK
jgi:Tfp pilus assembly protein PilX